MRLERTDYELVRDQPACVALMRSVGVPMVKQEPVVPHKIPTEIHQFNITE